MCPETSVNKLPISVCMISGAEARRIGRALQSVSGWASEIIVVLNDDVQDGTEEIALRHGAKVFREPWKGHVAPKKFRQRQSRPTLAPRSRRRRGSLGTVAPRDRPAPARFLPRRRLRRLPFSPPDLFLRPLDSSRRLVSRLFHPPLAQGSRRMGRRRSARQIDSFAAQSRRSTPICSITTPNRSTTRSPKSSPSA